jgi:hypothetical protein
MSSKDQSVVFPKRSLPWKANKAPMTANLDQLDISAQLTAAEKEQAIRQFLLARQKPKAASVAPSLTGTVLVRYDTDNVKVPRTTLLT